MSFRSDEQGAQEIIGFMLALAAVMLLFGAAVGFGVTVRDQRVDEVADAAVTDIARRISEAINDAAIWAEQYPDAYLNLTFPLARMPGPTGFIAEADGSTLYVNASNGPQATTTLPLPLQNRVTGSISGTPDQARVRWDPETDKIILETA